MAVKLLLLRVPPALLKLLRAVTASARPPQLLLVTSSNTKMALITLLVPLNNICRYVELWEEGS